MGDFVTAGTTPTVFTDKVQAPGLTLRAGWTAQNVVDADDMNTIKNALLDCRTAIRERDLNVKHYGARGNGVTDDTAAIQAVIDDALADGGRVYFPAGAYLISSTLLATSGSGLEFVGESPGSTSIKPTAALSGLPLVKWVDVRDGFIKQLHFEGHQASPPSCAIQFHRAVTAGVQSTHNTIQDCAIGSTYNGFTDGIKFTCDVGADTNNDSHQVIGCDIYNIPGKGIRVQHSNSLVHVFDRCVFTNVGSSVYGDAGSATISNCFIYAVDYDFQLGMDATQTQGYHPWIIDKCTSETGTALICRSVADNVEIFWRQYEREGGPAGVLNPIQFSGALNVYNFNACQIFLGQPTQHFVMGSQCVVTVIGGTMSFTHYDGGSSGTFDESSVYHTPGSVDYSGLSSSCVWSRRHRTGPSGALNTITGKQSATEGLTFRGACDDGATSVANIFDSTATLTTTAKIVSLRNAGSEKAFFWRDGTMAPTVDNSLNLGYAGNRFLGAYITSLKDPNSTDRVAITANVGNTYRGTAANGTYMHRFGNSFVVLTSGNILECHNDLSFTSALFAINYAGKRVYPASGSANIVGTATLVAGTKAVSTTAVKTGDIIKVSCNTPGGTVGFLSAPTGSIVDGTSFVINSSSATDTSTVNWEILRQG